MHSGGQSSQVSQPHFDSWIEVLPIMRKALLKPLCTAGLQELMLLESTLLCSGMQPVTEFRTNWYGRLQRDLAVLVEP